MNSYDRFVQVEIYDEVDPDEMIAYIENCVVPRKGDIITLRCPLKKKPDGSFYYRYKVVEVEFCFSLENDIVDRHRIQQISILVQEIEDGT